MSTPKRQRAPRSVTRQRSHARDRRSAIELRLLEAVERLLGEQPYTELPVQRIAEAAGVSRSNFYLHFADKTELLIRLAERATEGMLEEGAHWWRDVSHDDAAGLARTVARMTALYRRHAPILDAVRELAGYDSDVAAFWQDRIEAGARTAGEELREIQRAGNANPRMDAEGTARSLAWMVEHAIAEHVRHNNGPAADAGFAATLARVIWLAYFGDAEPGTNAARAVSTL